MKKIIIKYRDILILLFFTALIFWSVWQWNMNKINKNLQNKVSSIIKKTINQQIEINPFLPDVVLINADSTQNKQLTDSLKNEITSFLTDYYLKKDNKTKSNSLNFVPFFIFPQKTNKKGEFLLTAEQLNNLKYHINFLAKKVESEVNRTKEEVGRDIDRLNTWVTIWIGFIGLIGIFIPVILNMDVSRKVTEAVNNAKSAEVKSENANKTATKAINLIESKRESIEKIETVENKIYDIEKLSADANTKANEAKNSSEKAITETEVIKSNLSLIIALNSLKEFDANVIIKISEDRRVPFLKSIINRALGPLKDNIEFYDSLLISNWLEQFAVNIQGISLSKFISRQFTRDLNDISNLIDEFINDKTKENYQRIISGLERLLSDNQNEIAGT